MVVGIVAVLKAGGAYVPLDGGIVTQSTLDFVLDDSSAVVVVVLREYLERIPSSCHAPVVVLEDAMHASAAAGADCTKPADLTSPQDGVYVIYTSGSLSDDTSLYRLAYELSRYYGKAERR